MQMIRVLTNRRYLILVGIAATLFGCGEPGGDIRISDDILRVGKPIAAGELVKVETSLLNPSGRPLTITGVKTSCGCTSVKIGGASDISPARVLSTAAKTVPIEIAVDTQLKVGPTSYDVAIAYNDASTDQVMVLTTRLEMVVSRGLLVDPPTLSFSENEAGKRQVLSLTTDYLNGSAKIERIESSDPDIIKAFTLPTRENEIGKQEVAVELIARPSERALPAYIQVSLVPEDRRLSTVQIPIRIDPDISSLQLQPTSLVFLGRGGENVVRRVALSLPEDAKSVPQVEFPKALCNVTIEMGEAASEYVAVVQIYDTSVDSTFVITFTAGSEKAELPVTILPPRG